MIHIIAVSNRKGGVGKTTTRFSLGACLAEMGLRTLVVDLDSQGDLTLAAGWDAEGGEREPRNHPDPHCRNGPDRRGQAARVQSPE